VVLAGVLVPDAAWVMGQAQDLSGKRPMTFADLQRMKRVSDPQISPSGKWVMFSVTDVDLEKNSKVNHLWVAPIDGSAKERQGTFWTEGESGGRFSPDGRHILFTATDSKSGLSQIFLANWNDRAGTLGTPTRLTNVSTEADGAVWSPDSQRILFVSRVYPECSEGSSWVEEDNCDRRKDADAAANPVKAQIWDHLLYRHWNNYVGPKRSHVLVVSASDGNAVRDLTPREEIGDAEAPTFSLGGPMGYAWAPDSKEIAFVTNVDLVPAASTNNDVYTLRLDDPGARPMRVSTSIGSDDGPAYSPDGKWLAFRSQARAGYESDRFRLVLFDRTGGAASQRVSELASQPVSDAHQHDHISGDGGERDSEDPGSVPGSPIRELLPKFDRWVDEFIWGPDSKAVYIASNDAGRTVVLRYQFEGEPDSPFRVMSTDGEFSDLQISVDGTRLVATRMSVDQPAEINVIEPAQTEEAQAVVDSPEKTKQDEGLAKFSILQTLGVAGWSPRKQITHLNDALLSTLDLPKQEAFRFAGAGGAPVQGFLVRPPNFDETRKYPVKFLIHGGPQGAWGDAWSYRWNPELMAASGYVVVMVNPRGSTGYGQAFIDGVNGDWGGKAYVDLMHGLDYAEKQYPFLDKTRECALGASYGGYMADWILTHTNRFACIVTHDGMFNPQSAYGNTEELWFNEWEFREPVVTAATKGHPARQIAGAEPAQPWNYFDKSAAQDPFRRWSPMLAIKNARTPTLVIHSQRDYRLDVSEGMQLFTALQRLNVPSKMLYFPDEGHWILKPQNSKLWYETVGDWCDRWTKTNVYALTGYESSAMPPAKAQAADARTGQSRPAEMAETQPLPEKATVPHAAEKGVEKTDAGPVTSTTSEPVAPVARPAPIVRQPAMAAEKAEKPVRTGDGRAPFLIAISASSDEVQVGADARIVITLRNLAEHQILFAHKPGKENAEYSYTIVVRNRAGKVVQETAYGRESRIHPEGEGRSVDYVQPGQSTVQTAHLARLVNLGRPGEYRVKVSRKDPESQAVVESNEITLNVVP
jgi:dipeptidyl aminopeptidase/acylaminoacyl peptidase